MRGRRHTAGLGVLAALVAPAPVGADHLDQIGVPYTGIKENAAGYSIDLTDPDGHEIELTFEH